MAQTPRGVVKSCIKGEFPDRIPRDIWILPWAESRYPETIRELNIIFPTDFAYAPNVYTQSSKIRGDRHKKGTYIDEWSCVFDNLQDGIIGEVVNPVLKNIDDWKSIEPPYSILPVNLATAYDDINRFCENTDKFVFAECNPRPWERYQFIRGFEAALMDVLMFDLGGKQLLKKIHDYYLKEIEFWVKSDIDGIRFMDDWGTQNQLMIRPEMWREYFKPLYKDYAELAGAYGKFLFMHSDGYIMDIYEDLIDVGIDVINSQLFCMDIEQIGKRFKGRITFWGEIDRQIALPSANPEAGREAVRRVANNLYHPAGGLIAQFEFGAGANPETVLAVARAWNELDR